MKRSYILLLLLTLHLPAHALEIKGFDPDETRVYKQTETAELKLHIFYPEGHKASDQRPAIVFFFGGGWVAGSPSQFFPHCEYLASRGMVAMSAEYRVRSRDKTSPKECVKDGKSAIRWIRKHAGELGIDPNQIAAGGGSAGGHVAAAAGTLEGFEDDDEDLSISSRPNALVLFNPVFDNGPGGYGHERVQSYWKAISPMHNIDKNTPPTVVLLGTNDELIPVTTAQEYQRRMEALNLRCDLHLYEDQIHGFFNYGRGFYEKPVQDMDQFLTSVGYLPRLTTAGLTAEGKHLFILSGQSNMAGMNPEISFTPTVEKAFGKENVTVVKSAQSGAPIRTWYNNYQFPDNREINAKEKDRLGKNYAKLIKGVEAATAGKSYDTVTFVWMQGERDARESLSEVYAASFHGILDQLKTDLELDKINFVIGRISDFDMENRRYPHWTKIREIQVQLAENAPNGAWVDTDDLNGGKPGEVGGGLHYNGAGYATLGERFAEKAVELIKEK